MGHPVHMYERKLAVSRVTGRRVARVLPPGRGVGLGR